MTATIQGPVLLVGCGRLGSALLRGWLAAGALAPRDLIVLEPHPGDFVQDTAARGAVLNPPPERLAEARAIVLAVKPQLWRAAAADIAPHLAPGAPLISVAAGVRVDDLAEAFGGRPVARALPTTAIAIRAGSATVFAEDAIARAAAHALLDPVCTAVDLEHEDQMDAAIGVSGSAPGFFYAFVEALEAAGLAQGLPAETVGPLVRASLAGAAALMAETGEEPSKLRADVVSPGGTTQAGLEVFGRDEALQRLAIDAVRAAAERARELGKTSG